MQDPPLIIPISRYTTLGSAIVGTLIFVVFMLSETGIIAELGFYYLIAAFFINGVLFVSNLIYAFANTAYRKKLLSTALLMLLNIPLAILYLWLVIANGPHF